MGSFSERWQAWAQMARRFQCTVPVAGEEPTMHATWQSCHPQTAVPHAVHCSCASHSSDVMVHFATSRMFAKPMWPVKLELHSASRHLCGLS